MAIPRTIVNHPIWFDVRNWFRTFRLGSITPAEAEARVRDFEESFSEYYGVRNTIAFPFARTALYASLKSQGFEKGSEVLMPPITIKPMMDVVISLGLKPVFVDIELETLCFDPTKLADAITPRTRAALITYLFGIAPNAGELTRICTNKGLFVIEDFSHALNAEYAGRKLGTFGDVGIYSTGITKTLDAYGGGLAITADPELGARLRESQASLKPTPSGRLRGKVSKSIVWNLATRKWAFTLAIFPLIRLMGRLSTEMAQRMTGARLGLVPDRTLPDSYFERFTWLQADAAKAAMPAVKGGDERRIANATELQTALSKNGNPIGVTLPGARSVYWQFVVFSPQPTRFEQILVREGIDTGTSNLSLISGLGVYPEYKKACPNAEFVKTHGMYVPINPRLTARDLERVTGALERALSPQ